MNLSEKVVNVSAIERYKTIEDDFKKVHKNKYTYEESIYVDFSTPIKIHCEKHGYFMQRPNNHVRGEGCNKCGCETTSSKTKMNLNDFISRAKEKHGNIYDYSKFIYKNALTKSEIVCKKHGSFMKTPSKHTNGQGCPTCSLEKTSNDKKLSSSEFIDRVNKKHNYRYDYSKTKYKTMKDKITIICKIHGEFEQQASCHSLGGGCMDCANRKKGLSQKSNIKEFIEKARAIYGDKYDYSKSMYTQNKKLMIIKCNKCNNEFKQRPNDHLNMINGCKVCQKGGGFDSSKSGILYYLKVTKNNTTAYKIGITNKSVQKRYNNIDLNHIEILEEKFFENGKDCYNTEQKILSKYKDFQYKGEDILQSGNTELFTVDIFKGGNIQW